MYASYLKRRTQPLQALSTNLEVVPIIISSSAIRIEEMVANLPEPKHSLGPL